MLTDTEDQLAPPMQIDPALMGGTADLENRVDQSRPGSTEDLESRVGPHMNPMMAQEHGMEEPSPQGPPPSGKEQFHNTMSDFGHRAEVNRAAVIGLNPEDPDYIKKLSSLQAQHGAITQEKARYQMLHPWGGPESEHPGVLGKIGHVAGEIGNVVGNATLGKGNMSAIPGSEANIQARGAGGEHEENQAIENEKTGAQADLAEAKPEIEQNKLNVKEEANQNTAGKNADTNVTNLRKYGLKPGPNGMPVPIEYTEMSPQEQAVHDLKSSHAELADAQSDLAKFKSDPNSPMYQMAQKRVQIAQRNSDTAAARLQLDRDKEQTKQEGGSPTNQTKAMSEMAQTVLKQVPNIKGQIDKLAEKIGPGEGRWNQFWVNKGGVDDPDFAGLDTDLDLFASALVRTHFGARGGQQYREELRKQFSQAQSPEDLKSRIDHANTWIQGYADAGHKGNAGGNSNSHAPRAGEVVKGHRFKGGDPADKNSWEKVGP